MDRSCESCAHWCNGLNDGKEKAYSENYCHAQDIVTKSNNICYKFERIKDASLVKLKKQYEKSCNEYVKLFCKKHDLEYDKDGWVSGDIGTIICLSDYFVDLEVIRYDIDTEQPVDKFVKWYDYCLNNDDFVNYQSFCKGYEQVLKEHLAGIRKSQKAVIAATKSLKRAIEQSNGSEE